MCANTEKEGRKVAEDNFYVREKIICDLPNPCCVPKHLGKCCKANLIRKVDMLTPAPALA